MDTTATTRKGTDLVVVSDAVIDEVAHTIRDMHRAAGLQFACDVGQLVLDRFYGGDLDLLRKTGPKCVSFQKLARHPELPMSAAVLHQAVAVFELTERLRVVYTCKRLGVSHVRAVLNLPEDTQVRLLKRAEQAGWTVEKIEDEARRARQRDPRRRGGRPPLPPVVKATRAIRRQVDQASSLFSRDDDLRNLAEDNAKEVLDAVANVRVQLDDLERHVKASVPALDTGMVIEMEPAPNKPEADGSMT